MNFEPSLYGDAVARILALDGNGERLMPLAMGHCSSEEARRRLQSSSGAQLLPHARAPEAALAGLYLYFSCLDEAHQIAQGIQTAEGSYWHGIMHRQEPDASNASYWFRRVGTHPIFPALHESAAAILRRTGIPANSTIWDPFAFIELCEKARGQPGSTLERAALEIQRAEWQLLFDYCATKHA